ncbi:MAG: hypothetical protein ACLVJK_02900 [Alistipes putredinis]
MKKLFLCLLAITAAISTAWAQTPKKNIFGLRVGMDMSKISILDTGSGEKYLSELRTSFNIGLTDQIRLLNDKPFYFQFGLMLHNKGGKVQATDGGSDIELSLNAMYLNFPSCSTTTSGSPRKSLSFLSPDSTDRWVWTANSPLTTWDLKSNRICSAKIKCFNAETSAGG